MIGQTVSHYKILSKLGEGGMGVVYKAEDTKLKREVAIKFLPPQVAADSHERKRFEIEAQAAAALNHPNIATIHAIEHVDDQTFIVMEYIDGQELKEKIQVGPLPFNDALDIAMQIAKGLEVAHNKGIVHRDIKATNIMLTQDGRVKVMDFGLAKLSSAKSMVTKEGTTLGTVAYMSPEQAQAMPADHRSDLWSFGVVLYEMLTGELPFQAEHDAAWTYAIVNEQPQMPSERNNDIPPHLDSVVMMMLEKDRDMRFQNAHNVLAGLQRTQAEMKDSKTAEEEKAIAVLPFGNISPDEETDYFADGLAEELIINLSSLEHMRVVSRTTSIQYKGTKKDIKTIGRELNVRYVLEGSVRKFQDNLRISVQLIDVARDKQLWGETFKGKLADVFDIQEQVSKQIVDALMVKLTPKEKVVLTKRSTLNAEAFDHYLKGRDFLYRLTKNNVQFAIQLFEKAIELDPRYAAAYAGLGEAYATLHQYFEAQEIWLDKAIEASLKALMYDSTLSEAYAALGLAYFDKKEVDEAVTATKKAIELDSNNFIAYWILGRIYHTADRDREAIDLFRKVLEINPDFYSAVNDLLMAYERLGEKEKHAETLQAITQSFPRYLLKNPDDARARMYYGIHLATAGQKEKAKAEGEKALELNPNDSLMMYNAACLYARLGDARLAAKTLKDAVAAGQEDFEWIKRDPDLDGIRNEPEYIELMKGK
jgi:non-specific serine/threonine protein kinase